jgi:hypothetical protein
VSVDTILNAAVCDRAAAPTRPLDLTGLDRSSPPRASPVALCFADREASMEAS